MALSSMNNPCFVIEICQENKVGSGLFLIEAGFTAFIFIGSKNPRIAMKFYDVSFAMAFIERFPEKRQRFMRVRTFAEVLNLIPVKC
jgi:hypothetical protein